MTEVLVAGAGPTGLVAAIGLARRGVPFRIVDAAEGPVRESRALGVQARTLEVFDDLGIAGDAVAAGRAITRLQPHAGARDLPPFTTEGLDTPFPFVLVLPQADSERLLLRRLEALGGRVERRVRVRDASLRQDADGVDVELEHDGGRVERARVPWLLGCDGAHSAVRHGLGLPFEGARYEEAFLLADAALDWDLADGRAHAFLARDGVCAVLPLPGAGRYRVIADVTHDQRVLADEQVAEDPAFVAALVNERTRMRVTLRETFWTAGFRIHRRMVPRMREGRVFLAGDAAHIHSPVGGQGMNIGVQDAHALAWRIACVGQGDAVPAILDHYHAERHPVAAAVLRGTDRATRFVTLRNPVGQALRNAALAVFLRSAAVRRRIARAIAELDVDHSASPGVGAGGGARVRPDPTLPRDPAGRHRLLAGGDAHAVRERFERPFARVLCVLPRDGGDLRLERPDGIAAMRVRNDAAGRDALDVFLRRWFRPAGSR